VCCYRNRRHGLVRATGEESGVDVVSKTPMKLGLDGVPVDPVTMTRPREALLNNVHWVLGS
jgi:hypothetical protein